MKVGLFVTCLVDLSRPGIGFAALKLLEGAGCEVVVPQSQTCCGQPGYNAGDTASARALARKFLAEFERFDHVVVPSGSCGGMIRTHYPALFADDPDLRTRIDAVAAKTWELTAFLHDVVGIRSLPGRFEGELTYHDSCSGLRELGVQKQPRALIGLRPGVTLVEMKDARACCGFGGTFAVKNADVSVAMGADKAQHVMATGAEYLVTGDNACLMNIGGILHRQNSGVKPIHLAEILARTEGGER